MKIVIKFFFFTILLAGAISSTLVSGSNKKVNGIDLAGVCIINQAFAEDEPKIPTVPSDYEVVNCGDATVTNPDGSTTTVHKVYCSGTGTKKCECQCNS